MIRRTIAAVLSVFCLCLLFTGCGEQERKEGTYRIECTLKGGSGRASIEEAQVEFREGKALYATIRWSSPYYDFMLIDGTRYEPVNTAGNSQFRIPVVLDEEMQVSADTLAMSQPHLIEYTLYFDSSSLREK